MNEVKKNENEYVTKKEFKKAVKNINLLIVVIALSVIYMFFKM